MSPDLALLLTSLSRQGGGVFSAVSALSRSFSELGMQHLVLGVRDEWTDADKGAWTRAELHAFPPSGPRRLGLSLPLHRFVMAKHIDMLHLHGLWQFPSYVNARWSTKHRGASLVSPHGMLEPWALSRSRMKKRLAMMLYERRSLSGATAFHALTAAEAGQIRALGFRQRTFVVPNGVKLPLASAGEQRLPWGRTIAAHRNVALFIGRIHPKKGLGELLKGWAAARSSSPRSMSQWALVIAGWDEGNHARDLQRICRELSLQDDVVFQGALYDADKDHALRAASAFVLPSISEGLPMAALEAWAYGLPCILTPRCNLPQGHTSGAALMADPHSLSLSEALLRLAEMTDEERRAMGERGVSLVRAEFSQVAVAHRLKAIYEFLVGGGPIPADEA